MISFIHGRRTPWGWGMGERSSNAVKTRSETTAGGDRRWIDAPETSGDSVGESIKVGQTASDDQVMVSVVLTTNSRERYDVFVEAVESVLGQTHPALEVVLVIDEDRRLYERVESTFGEREGVFTHFKPIDEGLSASRNHGATVASGEVVAFTDDDILADPSWVTRLVASYERHDALAVGGPAEPIWPDAEPAWLPGEFYWLVGATHDGFVDDDGEHVVRNTFGCNIAFDRRTFLELGGFRENLGKQSGTAIQGEEAELCARMRSQFGEGVVFNPEAEVGHRVFESQIDPYSLGKRAFWQGYSKERMQQLTPNEMDAESEFLAHLLREAVPGRLWRFLTDPSPRYPIQLVALGVLTTLVGFGYLYGLLSSLVGRPVSGE